MSLPPLASSSQVPPFWHGFLSQAPALLQHWYTPNTLLLPDPVHSVVSPNLIGSLLSFRPSRQPIKLGACPSTSAAAPWASDAKSRAPWEPIKRQGSARTAEAGWCWSSVSFRVVELTSSRTLCQRPSVTEADGVSSEADAAFPQLYLKCSSPLVSWEQERSGERLMMHRFLKATEWEINKQMKPRCGY